MAAIPTPFRKDDCKWAAERIAKRLGGPQGVGRIVTGDIWLDATGRRRPAGSPRAIYPFCAVITVPARHEFVCNHTTESCIPIPHLLPEVTDDDRMAARRRLERERPDLAVEGVDTQVEAAFGPGGGALVPWSAMGEDEQGALVEQVAEDEARRRLAPKQKAARDAVAAKITAWLGGRRSG